MRLRPAFLLSACCWLWACKPASEKPETPEPKPAAPPKPAPPPAKPAAQPPAGASKNAFALPPPATKKQAEIGLKALELLVKPAAAEVKNAWLMTHGITGFGKDFKASDGRLAIDAIVHDFVETKKVGKKTVHYFPERKNDLPIEPHRNLVVKAMLEAGVPLERSFKLKKGAVTLKKLVQDAAWAFETPTQESEWRDFAWSLSAFLRAAPKSGLATHKGALKLDALSLTAINQLEDRQAFLREHMLANTPEKVEKRKQGIYGHTCGGLHFVQAATYGAMQSKDPRALARVRHQLEVVLFRWKAERRIYKEYIKAQPKYRWLLLVQELKFYGHVVETLALAAEWGAFKPTEAQKREIHTVVSDLLVTVAALEPAYRNQERLRKTSAQTFYDLIGDGCHAIRGLRRALKVFFPA